MMQYASQGLRNTARKGSNLLHGGHNGPGGCSANTQTRSMHLFSPVRSSGQAAALHAPLPLSSGSAPRNSVNKLLSFSRNLFQSFFTHLTAPGLKAPIHLPDSHPLHNSYLRGSTIQSRLSTAARYSLKSNALKRQANTFLPRGPGPLPPRLGGVAEVGLGMARNFGTGRPIFQHLAENVPVAVRALYEADLDLELMKRNYSKRFMAPHAVKKTNEKIKPLQKFPKQKANAEQTKPAELLGEADHYFSSVAVAPVTTYLLIPLAPNAVPFRPGTYQEPRLLPALSYLGSLHESHATHSLRVSSLFTRLDQANVWARGVQCSAYSEGDAHRKRPEASEGGTSSEEGVCTILKVEFVGWSKAEVRSVIGESGTGWCVLEEVLQDEDEGLTDAGVFSPVSSEEELSDESLALSPGVEMTDPSESFIIPTLDFSSSFNSTPSSPTHDPPSNELFATLPSGMANDPWVDDYSDSSSWVSTPYSEFSELDPPSSNGLFWSGHGLGPGLGFGSQFESMSDEDEVEPREVML